MHRLLTQSDISNSATQITDIKQLPSSVTACSLNVIADCLFKHDCDIIILSFPSFDYCDEKPRFSIALVTPTRGLLSNF